MPANAALTTFPFYSRDAECTHNRHWCSDVPYIQYVTADKLPTWALKNPGVGTFTVYCHNLTTGLWADITALLTIGNTTVGSDVWRYYDWSTISLVTDILATTTKGGGVGDDVQWPDFTADCGLLQLVIDAGPNTWYSEIFAVKPGLIFDGQSPEDKDGCIFLEITDPYVAAGIPYSSIIFTQRVWLWCDVASPGYEFTERGDRDGQDSISRSFAKVVKRHRTQQRIPEYMTDALAAAVIHGTLQLTDQYAATWQITDVTLDEPDWTSPCLAIVDFSYRRDLWIKENC